MAKGGYVLAEEKGELKAIIIATGSEVGLAMEACSLKVYVLCLCRVQKNL